MDFLPFLLCYVGLFAVVAVITLFSESTPFLSGLSGKLKLTALKIVYKLVPTFIINYVTNVVHYLFFTRNHFMQVVFGLLVIGGHVILVKDVLPLLYIFEQNENHMILPMVFLFTNLAAFHLCCTSNPGHVTPKNVVLLASLYKADGFMFKGGMECSTCKLTKPARSKHCSFCNRCVHRFDHHCIWTNNCVGAGNLRWFLLFLWTLLIMVVNGAALGVKALLLKVHHLKLLDTSYVDRDSGEVYPITIPVLIQHLFMQQPRVVFLISSLGMLAILLGLFTFYHSYLLFNNQTTNERYKMGEVSSEKRTQTLQNGGSANGTSNGFHIESKYPKYKNGHTPTSSNHEKRLKSILKRSTSSEKPGESPKVVRVCEEKDFGAFYNRGVLENLREVFFPWSEFKKLRAKNNNNNGSVLKKKKR